MLHYQEKSTLQQPLPQTLRGVLVKTRPFLKPMIWAANPTYRVYAAYDRKPQQGRDHGTKQTMFLIVLQLESVAPTARGWAPCSVKQGARGLVSRACARCV